MSHEVCLYQQEAYSDVKCSGLTCNVEVDALVHVAVDVGGVAGNYSFLVYGQLVEHQLWQQRSVRPVSSVRLITARRHYYLMLILN